MTGHIVDIEKLPAAFPTHRHEGAFWEALGRAVATFGFLEETLTKAIFAYTGTRLCSEEEAESAYDAWLQLLERSLSDQLGGLIKKYETAVRNHDDSQIENLDQLLSDLRQASAVRNVLCHGSWHPPDENGKSRPFFVNRQNEICETDIDTDFLQTVQRHVAELAASVISSVTRLGWQFPGSNGPGEVIWKSSR